jgi:hypothetical protein
MAYLGSSILLALDTIEDKRASDSIRLTMEVPMVLAATDEKLLFSIRTE